MPSLPELALWTLLLSFPAALIAAAASDIARYVIPNTLPVVLLAAFPLAGIAEGVPAATLGWHGLAGLVMLVIGFVLFARNMMGGGDVKLLAACAVWTGFAQLPAFVLAVALAGGLLALAALSVRAMVPKERRRNWRLLRGDLPYGTAIALGGLAVFHRLPLVAPMIAAGGSG
jgi:prepilin peptidase CpaA